MPNYSIILTRTAVFGIACNNMLEARRDAKKVLAEYEGSGLIEWQEDIQIEEIADDQLIDP